MRYLRRTPPQAAPPAIGMAAQQNVEPGYVMQWTPAGVSLRGVAWTTAGTPGDWGTSNVRLPRAGRT